MKTLRSVMLLLLACSAVAHGQQLEWVQSLGGQSIDDAEAVAIDQVGNVYVVGSFSNAIDFDGSSDEFILDSDGKDSYILKLDSDGAFQWVHHLDGVRDSENLVWDIAIDQEGAAIVVGEFTDRTNFDPGVSDVSVDAEGRDGYIVKIDAEGMFQWVKTFESSDCEIFSVDIDQNNQYFFAGSFRGGVDFDPGDGTELVLSKGNKDMFLLKLNADGELVWVHRHGTVDGEVAQFVKVDGDHLYWTGYFKNTVDFDLGPGEDILISRDESSDVFIQKLTLDGEHLWVRKYGGDSVDDGQHIATDSEGNVILGGDYLGDVYFSDDNSIAFPNIIGAGFVLKLNPEGDLQWVSIVRDHEAMIIGEDDQIHISGNIGRPFDFDPGEGELILEEDLGDDMFIQTLNSEGEHVSIIEVPSLGGTGTNTFQDLVIDDQGDFVGVGSFWTAIDFDPGAEVFEVAPDRFADGFVMKMRRDNSTALQLNDISSEFKVFPNPAQEVFEIDLPALTTGKVSMTLYNSQGLNCDHAAKTDHGKIRVEAELPNGIYLIRIEEERGVATLPLLIQR